jgi:LCP family protein required for cell wall assembly
MTPPRQNRPRPAGRRPRRKYRAPLWTKIAIGVGVVFALVAGGLIYTTRSLISSFTEGVQQIDVLGDGTGKTPARSGGSRLSGAIDLLLLGVDYRSRLGEEDTHADTIIILHVPASHDEAYLIPLERDLLVDLPPWPRSGFGGGPGKLTEAFFFGVRNGAGWASGADFMTRTVSRLTSLRFDGLAVIDFRGFASVVDALGTVRMCVDQETISHHMVYVDGRPQWRGAAARMAGRKKPIHYREGCSDMPGWAALDYSRERYSMANGNYDRQRHQMQLLKAIAHKATSVGVISDPGMVRRVVAAAGRSFILDTNGRPLDDFLFTLKEIAAADLVMVKINGGGFRSMAVGKKSYQYLDEPSKRMFEAVSEDELGGFLVDNPDFLVPEGLSAR